MPFRPQHTEDAHSAPTYINGFGFLPNESKQKEKKIFYFQISVMVLSFLIFFFLKTVLRLPILYLLRLFGANININGMTGLITVSATAAQMTNILVYFLSMTVTCMLIFSFNRGLSMKKPLLTLPRFSYGFLWYWMLLGIATVSNIATDFFTNLAQNIGVVIRDPAYTPPSDFLPFTLYLFSVTLLPALMEELLFRGIILQSMRRFDEMFAIAISAVFFTLVQDSMAQMLFSFLFGLSLGFFALRKGGLLLCILANFSVRALDFLIDLTQTAYGQGTLFWALSSVVVLSIALFCFFCYTKKNKDAFRLQPDQSLLTNREKVRFLVSNLGFWALVLFAFFNIINHIEIIN